MTIQTDSDDLTGVEECPAMLVVGAQEKCADVNETAQSRRQALSRVKNCPPSHRIGRSASASHPFSGNLLIKG